MALSAVYLREQLRIHRRLHQIANEQAEELLRSPSGSISLEPWRKESADLLAQSEKLITIEMRRLGLDPDA